LHKVCIGLNQRLFCSKHYKKKKKEKNHDKILYILKDEIIFNLKKIFKYTTNREQTFKLYQYLLTGCKDIPQWFNYEKDNEKYKQFTELTNASSKHYKSETSGYLKPKYFFLPVTHDRKIAKEHLIKLISSNKIQLKTVFNKHTKHLIKNIVLDNRVFDISLVGQFLVIETKKKSKKVKTKKKDTEEKRKKNRLKKKYNYYYNNNNIEKEEDSKEMNKNYKRVFCLCDYCGELKLFNNLYYTYIYTCKDCMYVNRKKEYQKPKMLIDIDHCSLIQYVN
jgi:hypothetical protein